MTLEDKENGNRDQTEDRDLEQRLAEFEKGLVELNFNPPTEEIKSEEEVE